MYTSYCDLCGQRMLVQNNGPVRPDIHQCSCGNLHTGDAEKLKRGKWKHYEMLHQMIDDCQASLKMGLDQEGWQEELDRALIRLESFRREELAWLRFCRNAYPTRSAQAGITPFGWSVWRRVRDQNKNPVIPPS